MDIGLWFGIYIGIGCIFSAIHLFLLARKTVTTKEVIADNTLNILAVAWVILWPVVLFWYLIQLVIAGLLLIFAKIYVCFKHYSKK